MSMKETACRLRYCFKRIMPGKRHNFSGDFDQKVFDSFGRKDGPAIELWLGYRSLIKKRWPTYYWTVKFLLEIESDYLTPALNELALSIAHVSRTLPMSVSELASLLLPLVEANRDIVAVSDDIDVLAGTEMFAKIPRPDAVERIASNQLKLANSRLRYLEGFGLDPSRSTALEVGCGAGYLSYAMAHQGLDKAIGIDVEFPAQVLLAERQCVLKTFSRNDAVDIFLGDVCGLDFPDNTFDLIHSHSVIEHLSDTRKAFMEMARMLKTGGLMLHSYDPWFSPQGGHALCILDFPWGHVRLSDSEFMHYIQTYRPHEFSFAKNFYTKGFQTPRLTLSQTRSLISECGLDILQWKESTSRYASHISFLTQQLLNECRDYYPLVTESDLLTSHCQMVLRKS